LFLAFVSCFCNTWVECLPDNLKVEGSNPTRTLMFSSVAQ
jgi:hypothetical protein